MDSKITENGAIIRCSNEDAKPSKRSKTWLFVLLFLLAGGGGFGVGYSLKNSQPIEQKPVEQSVKQSNVEGFQANGFHTHEIRAVVIPESKTVIAGTDYRAQIVLAARDTANLPDIVINGTKVTDPQGFITIKAKQVGVHTLKGMLSRFDPISNDILCYMIDDEYSVVPPYSTIAN